MNHQGKRIYRRDAEGNYSRIEIQIEPPRPPREPELTAETQRGTIQKPQKEPQREGERNEGDYPPVMALNKP
jgi:hypothetical protein